MKRLSPALPREEIVPTLRAVLRGQGIPDSAPLETRIRDLARTALRLFEETADPRGVFHPLSVESFEPIYSGEGRNQVETPLERIFPQARHLALFAVTLGPAISGRIAECFERGDFALGAMLDSAASEGAELAAAALESRYLGALREEEGLRSSDGVLRFSPGYCGWHVSGQRRLFSNLAPEKIGITLTASCLMEPLKSISGVIVFGAKPIFEFEDTFPFCSACDGHACRDRIDAVMNQTLG
jgi:hypothetical protein